MAKLIDQKYLIVIAGPTAVGKTSLSIKLAQHFNCPIISYDSRQFYNEMTIGTAKPNLTELDQAEHHFINCRSIEEVYTAGMFENDAIALLSEVYKNHDFCVAVGGSGLYIDALVYGIDDIPSDEKIREKLFDRWQNDGLEVLQQEVEKIDPAYYSSADMKNPRRVMRALEVFEITGKPYSSFRSGPRKKRAFKTIWVGLEMDLEALYQRINKRVDEMIGSGLEQEVKNLFPLKHLKALKTVGYREFIDYFEGKQDLDSTIELIKRNTRRYARKQYTWFRRNEDIKWFDPIPLEPIAAYVQSKTEN